MNFTREPILETIISAREGYKLSIKSTKNESSVEYLVDAVEVVCFGTTYFYRSGEPAHTFFVPAQDFEIVQVRQTRLVLKTPTEKSIKIAGGDTSKKASEKPQSDKKKSKSKSKDKKTDETKLDKKADKSEAKEKAEKGEKSEKSEKEPKDKTEVKEKSKEAIKEKKSDEKPKKEVKSKAKKSDKKGATKTEKVQETSDTPAPSSIFSHLLRPPESLISDSIEKYQTMMAPAAEGAKEVKLQKDEEVAIEKPQEVAGSDNPIDDPNLTSEPPKPFEKLVEEESEMPKKSLSLKEKVKQVLSPVAKEGEASDDTSGE